MSETRKQLQIVASLVFVIVFNILFFLFGGQNRHFGEWITYIFVMVSYAAVLFTPIIAKDSNQRSIGTSFKAVAIGYFLIEIIIAGMVFLAKPNNNKIVFAIQLILLGAFVIVEILVYNTNTKTVENENDRAPEVSFIKNSSGILDTLIDSAEDYETKKALQKLHDIIHSSQSKSDPSCYELGPLSR